MDKSFLRHCVAASVLIGASVAAAAAPRFATAQEAALFPSRVLAAHNSARRAAGAQPLVWDNQLGTEAAKYALRLALTDMFAHSAPGARRGAGENLWMGTRGAFGVETMVSNWASERRMFRAGVFPTVSRSGNWQDVGHYTQIVWPTTKRVGCALASNSRNDYLVCRYWPAGNVYGVAVRPR